MYVRELPNESVVNDKRRAVNTSSPRKYGPFVKIILTLITAIFLWQCSENRKVNVHYLDKLGHIQTLSMPLKDKDRLTAFIRQLFIRNCSAYTILGSKPITLENYKAISPFSIWKTYFDFDLEYRYTLQYGWETWEKYKHLFPDANIIHQLEGDYFSILAINKDQFNTVVSKYKQDFQEVLQREIVDGYQLLQETETQSLMHTILQSHQALMGIVLGYGRENAWKFDEAFNKGEPIGWVWKDEEYNLFSEDSEDEDFYYLIHYSCPSFAGDPDGEESLALKKDYLETKKKVIEYYRNKDFLEASLSLLAGHRPEQ